MPDKLISPDDLRREAQKLIAEGKMPKLETLLGAVAEARNVYGPKLKAARRLGTDEQIEARKKQAAAQPAGPATAKVDWQSAVKNKK